MDTAKKTYRNYEKPTSVYFDPEQEKELYERTSGEKVSVFATELFRMIAPIINAAYEDGFRNGKEEAAT